MNPDHLFFVSSRFLCPVLRLGAMHWLSKVAAFNPHFSTLFTDLYLNTGLLGRSQPRLSNKVVVTLTKTAFKHQ